MSPESALTHAEVDYREAKIDSRIRQYLAAPSQEHSVELFADFIIATDMTSIREFENGEGMQTEADGTPRMTTSYVSDESLGSDAIAHLDPFRVASQRDVSRRIHCLKFQRERCCLTCLASTLRLPGTRDEPKRLANEPSFERSYVTEKRFTPDVDVPISVTSHFYKPFTRARSSTSWYGNGRHFNFAILHSRRYDIRYHSTFLVLDIRGAVALCYRSASSAKVSRLRDSRDRGNDGFIRLDASFSDILIPGKTNGIDKYENFISGIYHGEITRNTLLALNDAAPQGPQPILFDLNKHYGLENEALGLVESACSGRDGTTPTRRGAPTMLTWCQAPTTPTRDEDDAYRGSRRGSREALILATLQCLKRQEIEQENFGYAPGEVSLRDRRATDVRQASAVDGASRMYAIGLDLRTGTDFVPELSWLRGVHEALRILLGADEVEKRVEMCLAEDGSGVGSNEEQETVILEINEQQSNVKNPRPSWLEEGDDTEAYPLGYFGAHYAQQTPSVLCKRTTTDFGESSKKFSPISTANRDTSATRTSIQSGFRDPLQQSSCPIRDKTPNHRRTLFGVLSRKAMYRGNLSSMGLACGPQSLQKPAQQAFVDILDNDVIKTLRTLKETKDETRKRIEEDLWHGDCRKVC
ncbi:hypothetical protein EDB85DRAFT_2207641 [Lactarius pseudohatsudake]|nr:hypothetical protein EDB85DRAFT_2207641 [Lactarius pseudohatsudake]